MNSSIKLWSIQGERVGTGASKTGWVRANGLPDLYRKRSAMF